MNLFWPTLGSLALLAALGFFLGYQNRDLLRAKAYNDFAARLMPLLITGVFVLGLPFVLDLARFEDLMAVFLVYVSGAALLTVLTARSVAREERRATAAFRKEDYEKAAEIYEELLPRKPYARYYAALAAALDASGDPHGALDAAETAVKLDPSLGIARYNRASALAVFGEKARAREDLLAVFNSDAGRGLRRAAAEALEILNRER